MKEIQYTSGQLARLTRTTVRTLQYYDSVGLLPSKRSENDRRYYSASDLELLQRILFYKQLGFE